MKHHDGLGSGVDPEFPLVSVPAPAVGAAAGFVSSTVAPAGISIVTGRRRGSTGMFPY
jgi:hypothetical protein